MKNRALTDRALIELLIAGTLPRIRELSTAMYRQARAEAITAGNIVAVLQGREPGAESEVLDDEAQEVVDRIWRAPLTTASVNLLRQIAVHAVNGVFTVDVDGVRAISDGFDRTALRRKMGLHEDDIAFVLPHLGAALVDVVRGEGEIEVAINRQPIRLRPDVRGSHEQRDEGGEGT